VPPSDPPYYIEGWHRLRGTTLELIRKGESRRLADLELRVYVQSEALTRARQARIDEQKAGEQKRRAIAEARANAMRRSEESNDQDEDEDEDELLIKNSGTQQEEFTKIRDRKAELDAMLRQMSADALNAPVRGIGLPSDPALSIVRSRRETASRPPSRQVGRLTPIGTQGRPPTSEVANIHHRSATPTAVGRPRR
jgi:hypothetical protein